MEKTAHGLKVISKPNQAEGTERNSPDKGLQRSLFPLRSSRSAIFVSLPDVDHTEFVSVLKNSGPAIIVELRRIRRFDFGPLNRNSIFNLFHEQGDIYLDLGTQSEEPDQHVIASRIEQTLRTHIKQDRPLVFLTSPAQNSPFLAQAIFEWLQKSGDGWEIYEVPHHGSAMGSIA
jgi:hypothetical protein